MKKSKNSPTLLFNQKIRRTCKRKDVLLNSLNFHHGNPLARGPNINTVKHCLDVYVNLKTKKLPN